jgi:glutamine amidotransferase
MSESNAANTIVVIDYGMGNLHSVASALAHVAPDANIVISADPDIVRRADRIVFPGVGAVRDCISAIKTTGVDQVVRDFMDSGKPLLAICMGMQALLTHSEENHGVDGLDMLEGQVRFFGKNLHNDLGEHLKVPHMGWNQVVQQGDHPMWEGIEDKARFYFVHSFFVDSDSVDPRVVAGSCHYSRDFAVALAKDNVFAVQFHPEKSHTAGLQMLKNFSVWDGRSAT